MPTTCCTNAGTTKEAKKTKTNRKNEKRLKSDDIVCPYGTDRLQRLQGTRTNTPVNANNPLYQCRNNKRSNKDEKRTEKRKRLKTDTIVCPLGRTGSNDCKKQGGARKTGWKQYKQRNNNKQPTNNPKKFERQTENASHTAKPNKQQDSTTRPFSVYLPSTDNRQSLFRFRAAPGSDLGSRFRPGPQINYLSRFFDFNLP